MAALLFSKHKASLASDAIVRMGRAGLEFYDDLLRGLKTENSNHCFGKALGAVLKVAPEKIPELLVLTDSSSVAERSSALVALAYCGKRATECYPEVETRLLAILKSNPEDRIWYSTTWALGECARTSATVDALFARLDSGDMARKGEIITALGTIGIEAERVVPRLIEMLDAYEEYDPDRCYHGEHERVVSALRGFGNAAALAVPALVRHIWEKPTKQWTDSTTEPKLVECADPDEEVITLLGELGALARDALPALLEVREQMRQRNHADESQDESSYWNLAIQRIQNATQGR
ncbi:MAG TPA: HEAT repeat domain-containing protein [Verrucomicrobiae bacterium]|nr:HEAT repeat domain-containing protein [Verrucomicrobiae bacterium]